MRAVVQRVSRGAVRVDGKIIGEIDQGLVVLLGVGAGDTKKDASYLAEKIAHLRIFADQEQRLNLSVLDVAGQVLAVSQFTLYGDCRQGRRPGFSRAAHPDIAKELYLCFVEELERLGLRVATGKFQAHMMVEIINDGPVTILLDSKKEF